LTALDPLLAVLEVPGGGTRCSTPTLVLDGSVPQTTPILDPWLTEQHMVKAGISDRQGRSDRHRSTRSWGGTNQLRDWILGYRTRP
jgi:hypothetical protein